ncbi:MAG: redoxin family protein [candidate division Zixibacteria bacterium]|nr:redoxin family protein [candidate division Zixibacteria bacterium]
MKQILRLMAVSMLILIAQSNIVSAQTTAHPEKAVCAVCSARGTMHGEEKVAGVSEYEGKSYYFCNLTCKEEFDADPLSFLPPVLPREAMPIVLPRLDGTVDSLAAYHGKVVLIDFWAPWCKPCVEMADDIVKLHKKYSESGFTVLGIAIDEEKPEKVKKYVDKKKIPYPLFLDNGADPVWKQMHISGIPALFLIDENGMIVKQWNAKTDYKELEAAVIAQLAKISESN